MRVTFIVRHFVLVLDILSILDFNILLVASLVFCGRVCLWRHLDVTGKEEKRDS